MSTTQAPPSETSPEAPKRRRVRRIVIWTLVGLVALYLIVMAASALVAKSSLDRISATAPALAENFGTPDEAREPVEELRSAMSTAHFATSHPFWRASEAIPFLGENFRAVRALTTAGDDVVSKAVVPLAEFDMSASESSEGRLDVSMLSSLADTVTEVAPEVQDAFIHLVAEGIDQDKLVGPLQQPFATAYDGLASASDIARRVGIIAPEIPTMLGAESPRNYLVLVQNNAEARSTGGNPAAMMMMTVDDGQIRITQQASSQTFDFGGADAPITALNASTEALYGDKVGRYPQDSSMTPDFTQTAHIMRAWWEAYVGDPGQAVLSIDPVALGYLLNATGPVQVADGDTLTAENAADKLLNEVYFRYPGDTPQDAAMQDQYFASAATAIFENLATSAGNPAALLQSLVKGYNEGRIMYASTSANESEAVEGTRFQGPLAGPDTDTNRVGVFVNDNTEGKLDYYSNMSVTATRNACEADAPATFRTSVRYNYTLSPDDVPGLPRYISTGNYFPVGVKSTNLVFYGPVGSTFSSAKVDGQDYVPHAGTTDLGRPAVRILVENNPSTSHDIDVVFTGGEGTSDDPLEIRHTPMVSPVEKNAVNAACG